MINFLRKHWAVIGILLVTCLFGFLWCASSRKASRLDAAIVEAREEVAAAAAVVEERDRAVVDADARAAADSARADSLAVELRVVSARTPGLVTRARVVARDTGTSSTAAAYIDSLSAQLEAVTVKMEQTIRAKDAEIASLRFAIVARDSTIIARDHHIVTLEGYAGTLEDKLNAGGMSIWWDTVLVLGGCGLGYALEGLPGCGKGAAAGGGLSLGYRGVRSFMEDLR